MHASCSLCILPVLTAHSLVKRVQLGLSVRSYRSARGTAKHACEMARRARSAHRLQDRAKTSAAVVVMALPVLTYDRLGARTPFARYSSR